MFLNPVSFFTDNCFCNWQVCHEAGIALECLTGEESEHFDQLLMTPCPFQFKFDYTFTCVSHCSHFCVLTAGRFVIGDS